MAHPPARPRAAPASMGERLLGEARQLGEAAISAFRHADPFARARLAIVATWALISVATLWITCAPPGESNHLGADVGVSRDSIMGVQVMVRNESPEIWEDVVVTLDGGWEYSQPVMRPHDQVVLPVNAFHKAGQGPPQGYAPRSVTVRCSAGKHRYELR